MTAICGNRSKQNSGINTPREDSIEIIHLFAAYKSWHSRTLNKWSGFFPVQTHLFIIISSSFRHHHYHHHHQHRFFYFPFVLSFCVLEFHTFFLFTGKKDLTTEKQKKSQVFQRFKRAETVQSESVIYLFILLYFLLLTSRLSKESSIWR